MGALRWALSLGRRFLPLKCITPELFLAHNLAVKSAPLGCVWPTGGPRSAGTYLHMALSLSPRSPPLFGVFRDLTRLSR